MDALSPIVKALNHQNLHYLKDNGIYYMAGVHFNVMSVFDKPVDYIKADSFKGDYKILKNRPPTGDNIWHLYNLADDPGETNDLAKQKPDIFQQLLKHYDEYVADNGVIDLGPDYYWATEMTVNTAKRRFAEFIPSLIFIILIIGLIVIVYIRRR